MHDYSWLKTPAHREVSAADRAAFRLAKADLHEKIAQEWIGRDEVQVQRWRASAASLRGEA